MQGLAMIVGRARLGSWQDALVFGPFAVYSASQVKHKYFRAALAVAGIATTLYAVYELTRGDAAPTADNGGAGSGPAVPGQAEGLGRYRQPRRYGLGFEAPPGHHSGYGTGRLDPRSAGRGDLAKPFLRRLR